MHVNLGIIKMKRKMGNRGFTLVELMVVVGIMGITLAASAPGFARFAHNWRLRGETDQLATFLRMARSAAVTKNTTAIFRFAMMTNSYFYFEDTNGNNLHDVTEYQSETRTMPEGIRFQGHTLSGPILVFGPRGNTNESGTLTVENIHARTRVVRVFGGTGNVEVE